MNLIFTRYSQHDAAPPHRPAPTHEAKYYSERLWNAYNPVDNERTDAATSSIVLGEAWDSNTEAKETAYDGALYNEKKTISGLLEKV